MLCCLRLCNSIANAVVNLPEPGPGAVITVSGVRTFKGNVKLFKASVDG